MKLLKEKILWVLENRPDTRNDDSLLTFSIIHEYMPNEMKCIDNKWYISTLALRTIREDNVKRMRCVIQNDEFRFLPTDPKVVKKRKINEERWRSYLNNEYQRI